MARIQGDATTRSVRVDGNALYPGLSQRVWNHSPDGFNWGYGGSGPAQLALAILLVAGIGEKRALKLHQLFKRRFIERLQVGADFAIDVDLAAWVQSTEDDLAADGLAEDC